MKIGRLIIVLFSLVLSSLAQIVDGSGDPGNVPIWTGSTAPSSTLGNSEIFQSGANVGIRTTTPSATLTVIGPNNPFGNAPMVLGVVGGNGRNLRSFTLGTAGSGGGLQLIAGNGGSDGHPGGLGGAILLTGGSGAFCHVASITVCGPGAPGNVILVPTSGNVGIGEMSPSNTLEVKIGGTTLADGWSTRSSIRFKTNIQPLLGALEKIEQLRGVSYNRKDDGRREIGVVAEEVDKVFPEVVSHDPNTNEVQGVDYSRLAAVLIEAVKTQQTEIKQLKARVEELTAKARE